MPTSTKQPIKTDWKKTNLDKHLPNIPGGYSWKSERGTIKWFLYVYKTNTFHLFTTREARRKMERKLRGKKKNLKEVARRGRFIKPLIAYGKEFFVKR